MTATMTSTPFAAAAASATVRDIVTRFHDLAVHHRQPRRYPITRTTTVTAGVGPAASDFGARIVQLLSAGTAPLLPLEPAGCANDCAIPAIYDRATGAWRHLTDLQQCQRPAAAPTGHGDPQ